MNALGSKALRHAVEGAAEAPSERHGEDGRGGWVGWRGGSGGSGAGSLDPAHGVQDVAVAAGALGVQDPEALELGVASRAHEGPTGQ